MFHHLFTRRVGLFTTCHAWNHGFAWGCQDDWRMHGSQWGKSLSNSRWVKFQWIEAQSGMSLDTFQKDQTKPKKLGSFPYLGFFFGLGCIGKFVKCNCRYVCSQATHLRFDSTPTWRPLENFVGCCEVGMFTRGAWPLRVLCRLHSDPSHDANKISFWWHLQMYLLISFADAQKMIQLLLQVKELD